ncbi:MAG: hypothetical protein U0Y10_14170 [Spirosomataceae bacterium]
MIIAGMNPLVEKILLGLFFFAVYWFVLRRYNSLGLRLFFLFTVVSMAIAYWIYQDEQTLKSLTQHGETYQATLLEKTKVQSSSSTPDNTVKVSFRRSNGQAITQSTSEYISDEEFNSFQPQTPLAVLYDPTTNKTYVKISLSRFQNDKWILYLVVVFFFGLGAVLGIFTRNYKVGLHEDTGDEYLEKDGKVIFDEKDSALARTTKRINIVSKLFQIFGKN